jgi:ferredoxin-NADP reductase
LLLFPLKRLKVKNNMKKYKWTTHQIIQETKDAVTIFFNTDQDTIEYRPGQYLNISCMIDGERVSRSYSFSSAPSDKFPSITVKRVIGGKMSNYLLDNAKNITEWDIEASMGNFILKQHIIEDSELVFLAGGSGISPLFSMLKSLKNADCRPLLLYASSTPEDTIFKFHLEEMVNSNQLHIFQSFTNTKQDIKGLKSIIGRFSPSIIRTVIGQYTQQKHKAHYFICGPIGLMELYVDTLRALQIPESHIHTEYFDPVTADKIIVKEDEEHKEILVSHFETHYKDNEQQTYECTSLINVLPGQTLLEAISAHAIQVPHSCKKGTCGSCWAIKENGQIKMINNYALTDEEVMEGKILLCQSYPLDQTVSLILT